MAVLQVLVYPDERLKQKSHPVEAFDESLLHFISDLEETMAAAGATVGGDCGTAARSL